MKLSDVGIPELIRAAYEEHCDCFLVPDAFPTAEELYSCASATGLKTIIAMPGRSPLMYFLSRRNIFSEDSVPIKGNVTFCPCTLLADPSFWEAAAKEGIQAIILLQAELVKSAEYGFLYEYSKIPELRSSMPKFVHLTAVFSSFENGFAEYRKLYECREVVSVGTFSADTQAVHTKTVSEKYVRTAKKSDIRTGSTFIVCSTRREAEELSRFMRKCCLEHALFHGGTDERMKRRILTYLCTGEAITAVVTKSIFQFAPFLPSANVISCGLPYSFMHAGRILSLAHGECQRLACIFCDGDGENLIRISAQLACEYFSDSSDEFLRERLKGIEEILKKIY